MDRLETEVYYQNGYVDRETRFIPSSLAEMIDHDRAMTLLDLQHAKDKLQEIDEKILDLAYEREYAIKELEDVGNKALGGWLCTSTALDTVAQAYRRLGWKSKLACEFVKHIRAVFFDDEDSSSFDDIICYGIESEDCLSGGSVRHAVSILFGTKKHDCDKAFRIYLVGKDGVRFDWKDHYIETDIKVFKIIGGVHSWGEPMIARSPKLVDIREAICRFVKSGEYEEIKYESSERDNLQLIVESLANGSVRRLKSEKMFESVKAMKLESALKEAIDKNLEL